MDYPIVMPRLSVVVPVSRGPEFVRPLIESMEAQTAARELFELILVVDGPSSYSSGRIAVKTVRAPHRHPCVKRNAGVEAASGEMLGFVDDDVRLSPGWVAAALRALDAGADAVTGPSDEPYSEEFAQTAANAVICSRYFSLKMALRNRERRAVRFYEIALCNAALKRAVWERVGGFNEVAYYWVDDAEFFHLVESLGFSLRNEPDLLSAHYKRPLLWPMVRHYTRQRWYAGLSVWLFPELYLAQLAVPLSIGLLAALALFPAPTLCALTAAFAGVAAASGLSLSPERGAGKIFLTGLATALGIAGNFLGFWAGLLCGPFHALYSRPARRYKAYRRRDRDRPFAGKEIVQPLLAVLRQTVPIRLWRTDFPQWLIYFVTARCNARCPMCFYLDEIEDARRDKELSVDEVVKLAGSLPKITYLSLSGGEPTLREDLVALVQSLIDAADPVYVSIPTNGSFPARVEAAIDQLSRRNPRVNFDVHLSLDGPAEIHDRIRGSAATYASVMETHRRIVPLLRRRDNVSVKFVVTCSRENVDSLEPFLAELAALECDRVNLVPLHGHIQDKDLAVPYERYLALARRLYRNLDARGYRGLRYRLFNAIKRAMDERIGAIMKEGDFGAFCGAGQKIVVLGPYGEVLPCEPLRESVGNVRDFGYDLPAVLRGQGMARFADKHLGRGKCHCNWGCALGNALVQDPSFYPAVGRQFFKGLTRTSTDCSRTRPESAPAQRPAA